MKNDIKTLKKLGPIPFWRGQEKCLDSLRKLYAHAADCAAHQLMRIEKQKTITKAQQHLE